MQESQELKEKKRFTLKVGVLLVLVENDQVLLSRRYNTGIADGQHVLPMGGLEAGETLTQAMIREAKEEANVTLTPNELQVAHVMHRLHHLPDGTSFPQVDVFFVVRSYVGVVQNMEPHKCDELKFYPLAKLPLSVASFIEQALRCIRINQFYSEFGWTEERQSIRGDLLQEASIAEILSPKITEFTEK